MEVPGTSGVGDDRTADDAWNAVQVSGAGASGDRTAGDAWNAVQVSGAADGGDQTHGDLVDAVEVSQQKTTYNVKVAYKSKKNCSEIVSEEQRLIINSRFRQLSFNDKRKWVYANGRQVIKKRCTVADGKEIRRTFTRYYFLPTRDGCETSVYKKIFLCTLGYSCDSILTESLQSAGSEHFFPQNNKRGSHDLPHKLKEEVI